MCRVYTVFCSHGRWAVILQSDKKKFFNHSSEDSCPFVHRFNDFERVKLNKRWQPLISAIALIWFVQMMSTILLFSCRIKWTWSNTVLHLKQAHIMNILIHLRKIHMTYNINANVHESERYARYTYRGWKQVENFFFLVLQLLLYLSFSLMFGVCAFCSWLNCSQVFELFSDVRE